MKSRIVYEFPPCRTTEPDSGLGSLQALDPKKVSLLAYMTFSQKEIIFNGMCPIIRTSFWLALHVNSTTLSKCYHSYNYERQNVLSRVNVNRRTILCTAEYSGRRRQSVLPKGADVSDQAEVPITTCRRDLSNRPRLSNQHTLFRPTFLIGS